MKCWLNVFSSRNRWVQREFVEYLEQNEDRLSEVVAPQLLAAMHVNSLMEDKQSTDKVRETLEKYGAIDEDHLDRLFILIGAHEGKDPREESRKAVSTNRKSN